MFLWTSAYFSLLILHLKTVTISAETIDIKDVLIESFGKALMKQIIIPV
jgi:hypothetical protein